MPRLSSPGRLASLFFTLALLVVAVGCDQVEPETCADGVLRAEDLAVGSGQAVNPNSTVSIYYVGRLGTSEGAVFDSTTTGTPFRNALPNLVPGFRFGVGGTAGTNLPEIPAMRIGGKRRITIPPNLGYGARTVTDDGTSQGIVLIPSCTTLVFDVELVDA